MKRFYGAFVFLLFIALSGCAQSGNLVHGLAVDYLVQAPQTITSKTPVLILMHGYGSNAADLFELRKFLPPEFLIVSAQAPTQTSQTGYRWYDIQMKEGKRVGDAEDLDHSRDLMVQFIGQVLNKYHADPKQVYLSGFSQGAMMSYMVGLSHPDIVKGIAPLSGKIVESLKPQVKNDAALQRLRIFIANGTADQLVFFDEGKASYDYLISLGLKPEFHSYEGMAHQIIKQEIDDWVKWIKE